MIRDTFRSILTPEFLQDLGASLILISMTGAAWIVLAAI